MSPVPLGLALAAVLVASTAVHGLPPTPLQRQVLPPVPGYIPVYIQHGDVVPEDTNEQAELFRVAGDNLPPSVVVSHALFGTPTQPSSDSSTSGTEGGANLLLDQMSSQTPSIASPVQQDLQISSTDKGTGEQVPSDSKSESASATATTLAEDGAGNILGDPPVHPINEKVDMKEIMGLESFPYNVEIGPDKVQEMIDAFKVDAEESQNNNAEQTSPASQEPVSQKPTNEETRNAD